MKNIKKSLLLIACTFILTSCSTTVPNNPSNSPTLTSVNQNEVLSPFAQFENLKRGEIGFDSEQVDNILKSYGIYDRVLEKVEEKIPKDVYIDAACDDLRISGFNIGNKNIALFLIKKSHLHVYVMFSKNNDKWVVDGIACQNERFEPEYRVEQSSDGEKYWLVVKYEANHGTGIQIYNEIWYNPDGSEAAEYPLEGYDLFLPEMVESGAETYFSTSASFDGNSKIGLSYRIKFVYGYKDNYQDSDNYKFKSEYRPVMFDSWEYDLITKQLKYKSSYPDLTEGFSALKHVVSGEYGILQGYIDFYRTRLGNKKITTLEEWEKFMGVK